MHRSKPHLYSLTASVRATNAAGILRLRDYRES